MTSAGEPPADRRSTLGLTLVGRLIAWVVRAIGFTSRIDWVAGEEVVRQLVESRQPVLLAFWHQQVFLCSYLFHRRLVRAGYPLTVLTSASRDGELGTSAAHGLGARVERGSTSRGGTRAARRLLRALRGGSGVLIIPDGPRGPAYKAKRGVPLLAAMSGVPIVPAACATSRRWKLRSWDRMIAPKPFGRWHVVFGEPITVADSSPEAIEEGLRRLEAVLDELTDRVDAAAGVPPQQRSPAD
jgi:hypothetical protein